MRRKPSLKLNIEEINAAPPPTPSPSRRPAGRNHTTYKDKVAILRNPNIALPLEHYLQTGQAMGQDIGARTWKQKLRKPRRREPEVTVEEYWSFFEQDASGSLNRSMGACVSEANKMVPKVNTSGECVKSPNAASFEAPESEEPPTSTSGRRAMVEKVLGDDELRALKEVKFKVAPKCESEELKPEAFKSDEQTTYLKEIIDRYPYPEEVQKKKRPGDEYKALFDDLGSPKKGK